MALLCLNCGALLAQNTLKGVVKDKNGAPVPYANVVLYANGAATVVKGTVTTDNGSYLLQNIANGTYMVYVSVLGYKTEKQEGVQLTGATKVLDFVLEDETETLEAVVVTQKKPVIQQTAEKLTVDLENAEMVSTSLQDVMKKVPGIIVANGNITYAGQQGVRILINGKTTDYMDVATLLRDMPADNIAKVELIKQPGAEYDAEGSGPIINIILKKNVRLGTSGNVKLYQGYNNQYEHALSGAVANYKNKLNWQLGAGYNQYASREDLYITRKVDADVYDQKTVSPYHPLSYNINGRLDYYVNEKNSIGVTSRVNYNNSDRVNTNSTVIITPESESVLLTDNRFEREQTIVNVNPYYQFEGEKQKFNLDVNFVDYSNNNQNNLYKVAESTVDYTNQRYVQNSTYRIFTFKADYKYTFSKALQLQTGAKYAMVNTDSDLLAYQEETAGNFVFSQDQSNRFFVDEDIAAVYAKASGASGKYTYSAGLRYEYSNTQGRATNPEKTNVRKISKVFPSASISRNVTDKLGVNLSYSYRIRRPSYNSLNSFVFYYDPYTAEQGNANLRPEFTNNAQFSFTYQQQPFFSIAYSATKNTLFEILTQNNETAQTARTTINLAKRAYWSFSLFAPLNFMKNLDGYAGVIARYNKFASKELEPALYMTKWSATAFANIQYSLPLGVNAELSGYYNSGGLQGQIDFDWMAGLDFAVSKKFIDDKLKLNMGMGNILNRAFYGSVVYSNINANIVSNWYRRNVYMQLTYNFGTSFSKEKKRHNASEEEENRIDDNK